jgi:hypothetical protein
MGIPGAGSGQSGNLRSGSPVLPLRKLQRNDIITAIRAIGLDPVEFSLEKPNDRDLARIKHRSSESSFDIVENRGRAEYESTYRVGDELPQSFGSRAWPELMQIFGTWLENVNRDLETPDLWTELQSEAKLLEFDSGDPADNTPFTRQEQAEIAQRLQELAENARNTYSLSEVQMRALNEKLSYLVDAAGRLGRTDWRGLLIGTMFSFALSAALPPDPARHIFFSILRAIGHRYGIPELGEN